jgi:acetyltransferase-like isoleucine patch superfamily enzyme
MAAPAVHTAIETPEQRRPALRRLDARSRIHERAFSEGADIGDGTLVEAHAYLGPGAIVGRDCRIGAGAHVQGIVGDGVVIGRGALVAAGVRVGDGARVAAGSVVVADVSPRGVAGAGWIV